MKNKPFYLINNINEEPLFPYQYANLCGYSDVHPYEIIARTKKTITIKEMDVEKDDSFKPDFVPGGFCGTVVNQDEQKWIITSNVKNPIMKAYLRKNGYYYSRYGRHVLSCHPTYFYDYNF